MKQPFPITSTASLASDENVTAKTYPHHATLWAQPHPTPAKTPTTTVPGMTITTRNTTSAQPYFRLHIDYQRIQPTKLLNKILNGRFGLAKAIDADQANFPAWLDFANRNDLKALLDKLNQVAIPIVTAPKPQHS